jgi:hypothetical protein
MKKSELKYIIKEEIRSVLSEERKTKMSGLLKDGKKKLEILKQSMKKDGLNENINSDDSFLKELTLFAQKGEELLEKRQENISESQKLNKINKYFHELANEGEELVKKMKERNGNL